MLDVDGLCAGYGAAQILHQVSLQVAAGEIVALLGRNGAGKSTCLTSIAGVLPPRSGVIRLNGATISASPPEKIAQGGLAWVPEDRRIFTDLTVLENLTVGRQKPRPGVPSWDLPALFALFPNLAGMRQRRGDQMSGGEQQMLAIARALMGNPRCLLLDEPSEGLAPVIVEQLVAALQRLRAAGVAILLAEQSLPVAGALARRAYVIETGRIVWSGSMDALRADPGRFLCA